MTNVTHKFLSMYLFLFITLYMFRARRAHHQERQIVSIQTLVAVTLKIGGNLDYFIYFCNLDYLPIFRGLV